ncbi:adenylate/guanylate cyclase domain-containing protein [Georgenia sp. TF02-10]|uniref:adenylate/guanylate cyclase domain-containing protein n=1 Tax=Georgenia sp. TF02-10 TaxID=2917725 RepID=UPI001FA7475B|nr:adenylate/guanylate cyclase domain-containing protein [Georgenia sp. TF02-10]UNX55700.1 adenylate/guanylate cyclase domain-containing protein [Georgenia sp. TF02-10]
MSASAGRGAWAGPVPGLPAEDDIGEARSTAQSSSTVQEHIDALLGGPAKYTIVELAARAGVTVDFARTFWRAMAFPNVQDHVVLFGDADVAALRVMGELVADGQLDESTVISLVRAQSHMTDRLVLWQNEALTDHAARRLGLDDASARLVVLDRVPALVDVLQAQLVYSWRRQLAALLVRTEAEVAEMGQPDTDPLHLPLQRALGFVDMVAYTRRSAELGPRALAELVQTFEYTSRDVITTRGARVVKTIGDAVLYVADDLPTAAAVAVDLVEALGAKPNMLPVRASVVWGRVLSRNGDVFGPTVNLASRLVDVAPPGAILLDKDTADALTASPAGREYTMVPRQVAELQGVGEVAPIELRRLPR